jgi:hypothetical protein
MRYAVAVTLTKDTASALKIVTNLNIYEAVSKDEARGAAARRAQEINPDYSVFLVAIVAIEEAKEEAE